MPATSPAHHSMTLCRPAPRSTKMAMWPVSTTNMPATGTPLALRTSPSSRRRSEPCAISHASSSRGAHCRAWRGRSADRADPARSSTAHGEWGLKRAHATPRLHHGRRREMSVTGVTLSGRMATVPQRENGGPEPRSGARRLRARTIRDTKGAACPAIFDGCRNRGRRGIRRIQSDLRPRSALLLLEGLLDLLADVLVVLGQELLLLVGQNSEGHPHEALLELDVQPVLPVLDAARARGNRGARGRPVAS